MIDWKQVEREIEKLLKRYDSVLTAITMSENIDWRDSCKYELLKYIKSLIAGEFKLVASGKPFYTFYGWAIKDKTMKEIIHPFRGKNISIYISENED